MDSALATLLLAQLPGVGERTLSRVLAAAQQRGEPAQRLLLHPPELLRRELGMPDRAIDALRSEARTGFRRTRSLAARLQGDGVELLTRDSPDYPRRIERSLAAPPPILFLYGNRGVLSFPSVALLSSREITSQLVNATVLATRCAVEEGLSVIVGGMKATHRIAAATGRAARAPRAVVLDRGVLAAFAGNLQRDPFGLGGARLCFDRAATLALSRFRPHDHAVPANGRKRDELIAALGDVLFVISARPGGETERLCAAAIDRGRCVLLWHGENRGLVAAGAHPVDEHEIRQGFRRFLEPSSQTAAPQRRREPGAPAR
jgi:DNA processing protein